MWAKRLRSWGIGKTNECRERQYDNAQRKSSRTQIGCAMVHHGVVAINSMERTTARWCQGGCVAVVGWSSSASSSGSAKSEVRVVDANDEWTKQRFNGTERFQDKLEIT